MKSSSRKGSRPLAHDYLLGAFALFLIPVPVLAQQGSADEPEVEEVVVTGSFIRNSQFTNASPVATITQEDLRTSGAANLGEYLRDLPYMDNIDTVASVLATQDGQQDSNSARFNLRGLGTESTLTLLDGRRQVNESAVSALLPGIAQRSVEIVTDGGAALYGSDAVAGVANIIPFKEYDGITGRVYYKTDQENSSEQYTTEFMMGHTFGDLVWVGAIEISKRTPFLVSERPKYQEYYNQDSTYNNPGRWASATGAGLTDPSCGDFNEGNEDISQFGSYPSGERFATGCRLYFGEWQDYARPSEGMTIYNNFTYQVSEGLSLEFQMNINDRTSTLAGSPSGAVTTNLGSASPLYVPVNHPANPFGQRVRPSTWRPFTKSGTMPSLLSGNGMMLTDYDYYADAYKFGGTFEIGDTTWQGETWIGYQDSWREYKGRGFRLSKMISALNGRGGPAGNDWFNPFGSADPRSPDYVAGVTDNSQELVDWLVEPVSYRDTQDRLTYLDFVFNGEVFDLPNGTVRAAFGGQYRSQKDFDFENPLTLEYDNLYATATTALVPLVDRESNVRALFGEVEIPILDNLGVKAAVRSEDFYTIGFSATKPKISVLWEPLETLSLRASYGESFLAPTPGQLRPLAKDSCTIVTTGVDPLTGISLDGVDSCTSGNPILGAEESEIVNFGLSWRPIEGLSIDLDYQEIEYIDRISTLITSEVTRRELNAFLAATGRTAADFRPTTNPADAAAGIAWANANPNVLIARDPEGSGRVTDVYRAPINLSSQYVEGFDFRVRYSFDVVDLGSFTANFGGNYYTRWEYLPDEFSPLTSGVGMQNATTNLAPPLHRYKMNAGLSWFRGDHGATVTVRHLSKLRFDTLAADLTLNYEAFAPDFIRPITKVDARYSYSFDALSTDANLTLGITNLFDRDAQRLPVEGGLETRVDDPFGRQFYISVDFDLGT